MHLMPPTANTATNGSSLTPDVTVRAFQQLIHDRYFVTDNARGSAGTFLLFMEEVGELATALHDNRPGKSKPITPEQRANLIEEFADVMAWLATLANINGVDLADALQKYTEPGRVEGTKD
jgi:NTP pyrophosphatase (non-canonical NTP hydrolase)